MKKMIPLLITLLFSMGISVYATDAVPLRSALEQEGIAIQWQDDGTIIAKKDGYHLQLRVDSDAITTDEGVYHMEQPVELIGNTTYISADTVSLVKNLYLYHNAIIDAMQADEDERQPLKAIDTTADKVLVCTWNRYPDSYVTGSDITLQYGDVWVFTAEEVIQWGNQTGMTEDMTLRMEQLIGLPPQKGYTNFSLLWVTPEDLYRPSADNEIGDINAALNFPQNTDVTYIEWFNKNIISSYYPHKFPWTRLGYTYDWADNSKEYGLSEFILKDGASAKVEKTYTNEEFYNYITQ